MPQDLQLMVFSLISFLREPDNPICFISNLSGISPRYSKLKIGHRCQWDRLNMSSEHLEKINLNIRFCFWSVRYRYTAGTSHCKCTLERRTKLGERACFLSYNHERAWIQKGYGGAHIIKKNVVHILSAIGSLWTNIK